jgi:hypothetical protein
VAAASFESAAARIASGSFPDDAGADGGGGITGCCCSCFVSPVCLCVCRWVLSQSDGSSSKRGGEGAHPSHKTHDTHLLPKQHH